MFDCLLICLRVVDKKPFFIIYQTLMAYGCYAMPKLEAFSEFCVQFNNDLCDGINIRLVLH